MTDIDEVFPVYCLHRGSIPLLISMPHVGTNIPDDVLRDMTEDAGHLDDTDWHIERLYGFALAMGASLLVPKYSRYLVDLNRPPDDANLYPGKNTTGLFPQDSFDQLSLYAEGRCPDAQQKAERRERYWRPYHEALKAELGRLKALHGHVLLWDAHSIRSCIPRLFEGRLPDFNFGSADGASALPGLAQTLSDVVTACSTYSSVANGRFKGGYITRCYGNPATGVHAMQLELAQCTYMSEQRPYDYQPDAAERVAPVIQAVINQALIALRTMGGSSA
ncbi:N-formylglutamate deformylase [Allopusillimonas ginsengisoli]|uniref:N-formylglutamate deformylase n=1 Tax=Allopusillimonas ginsengisoli TaxID=453575 RepID=UPI0010C1A607|nr:N-formylglutamate deformylase [Allopusillimonas ginsengisoli]